MHQHDQQQPETPLQDMRRGFNLLLFGAECFASMVALFLRQWGTMGERAQRLPAVIGLFLPLLIAGHFTRAEGGHWLMVFFWACLFMLVVHRAKGAQLRRQGYVCHSRYDGKPWIPGDEIRAKSVWEPLCCFLLAVACLPWSPAMAVYLFAGGISIAMVTGYYVDAEKAKVRELRDKWIEQHQLAELFRKEVHD